MKKIISKKNDKQNKSNRGRPKKEFKLTKPQIKRDHAGRPKKSESNTYNIKSHNINENKTKDTIIFLLFLCSAILFIFSIYVAFFKQNNKTPTTKTQIQIKNQPIYETIEESTIETSTGENKELSSGNISEESTQILQQETPKPSETSKEQQLIQNFYTALQTNDLNTVYQITDTTLKQSQTFSTYFNQKRRQRFTRNISNNQISIENIQINTPKENIIEATYDIIYTTTTTQEGFRETRNTTIINKDNEQKIGKIMCTTNGCSKNPFFNPGKYNFK